MKCLLCKVCTRQVKRGGNTNFFIKFALHFFIPLVTVCVQCTLYCTVHSLSICFFPYHFFLVHFIMKKKVGVFAQKKGKRNYFIFFSSYIKICSCVINKSECKMSVGSIFCWLRVLEIHSLFVSLLSSSSHKVHHKGGWIYSIKCTQFKKQLLLQKQVIRFLNKKMI